jgi:hypothetical protein
MAFFESRKIFAILGIVWILSISDLITSVYDISLPFRQEGNLTLIRFVQLLHLGTIDMLFLTKVAFMFGTLALALLASRTTNSSIRNRLSAGLVLFAIVLAIVSANNFMMM